MNMKNITFTLAALSLALVARSATVEWTSGDLNVDGLAPISSVTAYYYAITDATAAENAAAALVAANEWGTQDILDTSSTGWDLKSNPNFKDNVTSIATKTDSDASDGFGGLDFKQTISESEYIIAVYEATTEFGGKYVIATLGYYEYDTDNGVDPDYKGANSLVDSLGYDATNYNTTGWAAVPEPTTVALLALGLAAVGLKRKVA